MLDPLLALLDDPAFRASVEALGGYSTAETDAASAVDLRRVVGSAPEMSAPACATHHSAWNGR